MGGTRLIKTVIKDRDKALEDAETQISGTLEVYTNASIRDGIVGIGVYGERHAAYADYCQSTRGNYTYS